jgi:hypothetical protein
MGYFSFAYEGVDPQARILTRNTFGPLDTIFERLGVVQNRKQTTSPGKAAHNLISTLEEGQPAIVWADMYSLPYNVFLEGDPMWFMHPIVVYGFEPEADQAYIADRAAVPLIVSGDHLAAARGKVKKDKFRLLTLDPPNEAKLSSAVQQGIWDCIKLYTEAPPMGARYNFGLEAFDHWARMLVDPKHRLSWAKVFPPGRPMYSGLSSAFWDIQVFGKGPIADRALYADFLDEAALLLDKPPLHQAAQAFRITIPAWEALGQALLADEVPLFAETRNLILESHDLFLKQGFSSHLQRVEMQARQDAIRNEMETQFPLDSGASRSYLENLRQAVLDLGALEAAAVERLQDAMC